jgi:hypothetical protein
LCANCDRCAEAIEEVDMIDDNVIQLPASQPDAMQDPTEGDARDDRRSPHDRSTDRREQPAEQEPNPLMRDGPDAPDAADIEDPSEQL